MRETDKPVSSFTPSSLKRPKPQIAPSERSQSLESGRLEMIKRKTRKKPQESAKRDFQLPEMVMGLLKGE